MRKRMKAVTAAVAAIMLTGSILPANAGAFSLLGTAITAHAAEASGTVDGDTLYLGGEITLDFLRDNFWDNSAIKHIVADETCVLPEESEHLFQGYAGLYSKPEVDPDCDSNDRWVNLESIDLSRADSSGMRNTRYMFANCENLKTITFGDGFDTSKTEDMADMFLNCRSIEEIDLSSFDTSSVESMADMFRYCYSLKKLDLSSFNPSKVTDMQCFLLNCENLESITFGSSFNTSNVTRFSEFFDKCKSLKEIDLSGFDTSSAELMYAMFNGCESLTELDLTSFDTSKVKNICGMFSYCYNLETIRVSPLWSTESLDTGNWGGAPNMFAKCEKLTGGEGTAYDSVYESNYVTDSLNYDYARIDGGSDAPGFFTFGYPGNYVKGASIALDGWIGVAFWVHLSDKAATAVLDGPNGKDEIPLDEWGPNYYKEVYYDPDLSELIYKVNVLQAGEEITLTLYDESGKQLDIFNSFYEKQENKEISYSVNRYIEDSPRYYPPVYIEEDYITPKNLDNLVDALDNYCKAASNYFKNTDYAVQGIADVTKTDFDEYEPTLCGNKMALVLDSGTAIRIFSDSEYASYVNLFGDAEWLERDKNGYFEISDLQAIDLDTDFPMIVRTDDGEAELHFSALSYGYLAMQLDPDDPKNAELKVGDLQVLVKALLVYANATKDYL